MASKAKVASMQRGARKHGRDEPIDMRELYSKHPPRIAAVDKPHLDFVRFGKMERVPKIVAVITAARRNGIGQASEIALILNKIGVRTAVDGVWSPRLAWFASQALSAHLAAQAAIQLSNKAPGAAKRTAEDEFEHLALRAVKSRLQEINNGYAASSPKLGDALPDLETLKMKLEGRT